MKLCIFDALLLASMLLARDAAAALATPQTVPDRIAQFGEPARRRLRPLFKAARVSYPPARTTLVYFKSTQRLELYASSTQVSPYRLLVRYPVLAASGSLGPKLRQGDHQVPEGLYRLNAMNANSAYHVSLRVNYPNAFDRARAQEERRTGLGGDIMIHGKDVSVGCLAMGDQVAENLFTLAADAGYLHWQLILSPVDFRRDAIPKAALAGLPKWVTGLYRDIATALAALPKD
jgi:hypothetical protein